MQTAITQLKRISSIDLLRGIAMVVMALDHVRDFFHQDANIDDPLNLATTSPILFFTRWITHFCAPIFVLLSGTSIYLQSLRKTKSELSIFLLKRGLWLILAEWVIISLGWTFNPFYNLIPFQVIWTIGISMVVLAGLVQLPYKFVLALGLIIVFGHNLLDIPESAPNFKAGFFWNLLHAGQFTLYEFVPGHFAVILYPFLPWTGLMMLGYCLGTFFTKSYTSQQRINLLSKLGISALLFFIVVRWTNVYGDPVPWTVQTSPVYTVLSFLKVFKYPPSLMYLSMTIGMALLLLAWFESCENKITRWFSVFGRTAFFYYILHIYLIHLVATIVFFVRGNHTVAEAISSMPNLPFLFIIPGEGFTLGIVYLVWLGIVLLLYPVCKWYDGYKSRHKEKWWLSYL